MLQRGRQEMFTGHKHYNIIGRFGKLIPISFARQAIDMVLHRLRVARHGNCTHIIVHRVKGVLIVIQRHFRVDHQRPAAGDMDDRVGPQS